MSTMTATRSAAIALSEERQAMQEGYVFLDEKCLLLAAAMLGELRSLDAAKLRLAPLQSAAATALAAALARHGLQDLQSYPASAQGSITVELQQRLLLNVPLLCASTRLERVATLQPVHVSPEAEACRTAFLALAQQLQVMAATSGNLARLYREYRRSVRRVRALQDVLLPELEAEMNQVLTQLEELERDELLGAGWELPGTSGHHPQP